MTYSGMKVLKVLKPFEQNSFGEGGVHLHGVQGKRLLLINNDVPIKLDIISPFDQFRSIYLIFKQFSELLTVQLEVSLGGRLLRD